MGLLTLSGMKAEVRANLGGRTDLDDRLATLINLAQDRICRVHDFEEMQELTEDTLTASSATYSLSTRPRQVYSVRVIKDTRSRKLVYIPNRTWDSLFPKTDEYSEGIPAYYTVWQDALEFWRIPMEDYTVRIRWSKWPTSLSDDEDVSDYENKDGIIIAMATGWAFNSLAEDEKAALWMARADRELSSAIVADGQHADRTVVPISELGVKSGARPWLDPFVRRIR